MKTQTISKVTEGIKVSVETIFQDMYSDPAKNYFLFTYKIRIENTSDYDVQLQRRKWDINDSIFEKREVEGAGVVGQQPILRPGQVYEYESACNLKSEFGKMSGNYTFERVVDGAQFKVDVPEFRLQVPYRMN
jgi:ApaG protein